MKKVICLLTVLLALCTVCASADTEFIFDEANLLDAAQEQSITADIERIRRDYKLDIIIVLVDDFDGLTAFSYAENYYDNNGCGYGEDKDGILFLLGMQEREWYIMTNGKGYSAIPDGEIYSIGQEMVGYLRSGEYAYALDTLINETESRLIQLEEGEKFNWKYSIIGAVIFGFIVAFIVLGVMKGELKSVRPARAANTYMRNGSLAIKKSRDIYLYTTVSKRPKPQSSNTGRGGTVSRGGGGGKF